LLGNNKKKHGYFSGALARNRAPEKYYSERNPAELETELKIDRFLAYAVPIGALAGAYFYAEERGILPKTPFFPDYTIFRHIAACFSAGTLLSAARARTEIPLPPPESGLIIAGSREVIQTFTARNQADLIDTGYDSLANVAGTYLGIGYSRAVEAHFSRLAGEYANLYQAPILGVSPS